jgi:ABC-2 type transport system permease protein
MSTAVATLAPPKAGRAFIAILRRDVAVTARELPMFLAQVGLQPLFLLFVFGKILTVLGYARHGYAELLFPGIVALTAVLTALQSTALPMVMELNFTMEIEDRLLAPLPTPLVAVEKVIFASLRALVAAGVMFPIGIGVLGGIPWRGAGAAQAVVVIILGALVGAAMGMVLGTVVPPNRINMMFALILTPLLFTGSSQYPWPSLSRIEWFQVIAACNPLTYVSEGLRGALVPHVPHIAGWVCVLALVGFFAALLGFAMRSFARRVVT